ncbi:MAG: RNA methyltransferase, partial [Gemmatimonadetes bacterium]|nr:RNA methyltransferase [Gemmatimonadota bacterium]
MRGLKRRKVREAEGLFLAEGVRVVEELLDAGVALRFAVVSSPLEDSERGRALADALAGRCPLHRVGPAELAELAGTETPQGVLVVAAIPRAELNSLEVHGRATVLVLDAVQDPGNFGTLVRSAEALGVVAVAALPG